MKYCLYLILAVAISSGAAFAQKMNAWDKNADGKMNLEEFLAARKAWAASDGKEYDEHTSKWIFKKKDANKDGFVDPEEYKPKAKN